MYKNTFNPSPLPSTHPRRIKITILPKISGEKHIHGVAWWRVEITTSFWLTVLFHFRQVLELEVLYSLPWTQAGAWVCSTDWKTGLACSACFQTTTTSAAVSWSCCARDRAWWDARVPWCFERSRWYCCATGRVVPETASSSWWRQWGGPSADCERHQDEPTCTYVICNIIL